MPANCTVHVERLPDGRFRATAPGWPDCSVVADSEPAARQAAERSVEELLRRRAASVNPIDGVFQQLRAEKRKAFIPFLTAGDPDLATTGRLVRTLADNGASLVEIGFPYSDPIADGPVIQASYTRALNRGIRLDDILDAAPNWLGAPLVGMVSYSIVHRRGAATFVDQAKVAGFSGAIVPDLPLEEADSLGQIAAERDFKLIRLVTPTTPPARAAEIARLSTGFLYCVSITGITGEQTQLPTRLLDQLRSLRQVTDLPLCVGFGISQPEHVHMLRDHCDGVIVGSALVKLIAQADGRPNKAADAVAALARSLAGALHPGG
jgi:tryptophan synthase alpha chain